MAAQSIATGGLTGFPVGGGAPLSQSSNRGLATGTTHQFQNPNAQWVMSQLGSQAPTGLGNRYGSGARVPASSQPPARRDRSPGGSRRQRSRDRSQQIVDMETDFRTTPAGPQEGSDWLQALETVNDRLDTLERHQRLHAQTIAHMEEDRSALLAKFEATMRRQVEETSTRFDAVHARMNEGNQNWKTKFTEVDAKFTELENTIAHRDSRIELMQGMIQRMSRSDTFPPTTVPQAPTPQPQ